MNRLFDNRVLILPEFYVDSKYQKKIFLKSVEEGNFFAKVEDENTIKSTGGYMLHEGRIKKLKSIDF